MKITEQNFLTLAKSLPLGGKRKYNHCGNSPSMTLHNDLRRVWAYCHRCEKTYQSDRASLLSMAELDQYERQGLSQKTISVPSDCVQEYRADEPISLLWMTWLLRGGISQELRSAYSLGWSKKLGRAVLPVYTTHSSSMLETLVLRALLPNQSPKYIMDSLSPNTAVFLSKPERASLMKMDEQDRLYDVVFVEDVLSCIRVGEYVPTGSLLGTGLGSGKLDRIISAGSRQSGKPLRCGLWLDPDKAGQQGNKKLLRSLSLMGLECSIISSPRDPKNMSNYEIQRRLLVDRCDPIEDYAEQKGLSDPITYGSSGCTGR
ncbi:DNA primase [Rhizobium phage RHEph08]|uniref:Putative DNA primase protein n=1 Tax=Rhizobium phage RHEph08 TaxID=1220715 RepID=L7TNQ6_9CAUD|nr:DNA primase [Rhizobium phage RHEph08]AGC35944.1 putative DNA primase protein [Rhizobium phage RHEph08]